MESLRNIYNCLLHFMAHTEIETQWSSGEVEEDSLNKSHTCMLPSASPATRSEVWCHACMREEGME
jgi:hypothetical protein